MRGGKTMHRAARSLGWLLLMWGGVAAAAPQVIPPQLQDWQAWVLHGHERQTCPMLATPGDGNDRECVWPGRLTLDADKSGAHFQLHLHVDVESWVALPGDRDAWPQQVRVDNAPAVLLDRDGVPTLRLSAGDYVVQGDLRWNERPARLRLPAAIALVDLKVDGVAVARPERDGGWITLGPGAARQREADALSLRVFRRLADGAPPTLETVIRLQVAGRAREQSLGPVLPHGFVATALALRYTRCAGAQPVDPGQANVPDEWRGLPAFAMGEGATLEVQERARGQTNAGDRLRLARGLWLDFDGGGLIANDHLTGNLRSSDRLDVAAPWTLTDAHLGDAGQPLLVTRGDKPGTRGVELRARALDLHASLRLANRSGAQSTTGGWQQTLDRVDATLHLPYGYRLLGAPGADRSPDSWVAQWNLLDLFVVALIALLVWRWLGWRWALTALAFVVLSHGEAGAPRWLPALAVAFGLAARALPDGKLRKAARYTGIVALVLAALATLPFAAAQLRNALHPQLEGNGFAWIAPQRMGGASPVREEFIPPPPMAAKQVKGAPSPQELSTMATPAAPPPPAPPPPEAPPALPPPADVAPNSQTLQSVAV